MPNPAASTTQPQLPNPAGGSMLPGVNPAPASAKGQGSSWNYGTYGLGTGKPAPPQGLVTVPPKPIGPPAAAAPPPTTAPQQAPPGGNITNHLFSAFGGDNLLSRTVNNLNAPPLSHFTHHLGSFKGTADNVLNFVQRGISGEGGAQRFASFASMAKPIMDPLMATPLGALALPSLYGVLGGRGMQGASDAYTLFKPLMGKLGLGS